MTIACLAVGKPRMGETKLGSCTLRGEFDSDHGLGAIGAPGPRYPGQFDQLSGFKT